jgi:hypothetical protein
VDLIQDTVGDLSEWLDQASTIRELNGNLVIKTTPENHEQIRQLLAVSREAQLRQFQHRARLIEVLVLLRRAEGHRLNQEYRDALRCLDQALRVDPENPQALALKEIVEQTLSR